MADLSTALRVEKRRGHDHWIFACAGGCGKEVPRNVTKARREDAPKCKRCSSRTRPYQHVFTKVRLTAAQQGLVFGLSYEDVLALAQIKDCHYCGATIPWSEWSTGSKRYSKGYFLDRKDNSGGYERDNVVVCCTDCNRARGARYSYDEFMLLAPALRQIRLMRETAA